MTEVINKALQRIRYAEEVVARGDYSSAVYQDMMAQAVKDIRLLGKEGVTIESDSDFTIAASAKAGFPDITRSSKERVAAESSSSKGKVGRPKKSSGSVGESAKAEAPKGQSAEDEAENLAQEAVQEGWDPDSTRS